MCIRDRHWPRSPKPKPSSVYCLTPSRSSRRPPESPGLRPDATSRPTRVRRGTLTDAFKRLDLGSDDEVLLCPFGDVYSHWVAAFVEHVAGTTQAVELG